MQNTDLRQSKFYDCKLQLTAIYGKQPYNCVYELYDGERLIRISNYNTILNGMKRGVKILNAEPTPYGFKFKDGRDSLYHVTNNNNKIVILSRLHSKKDSLIGYVVRAPLAKPCVECAAKTTILTVGDAVELCGKNTIANGRIRETNNGKIVQSIKGEFAIASYDVLKVVSSDSFVETSITKEQIIRHFS